MQVSKISSVLNYGVVKGANVGKAMKTGVRCSNAISAGVGMATLAGMSQAYTSVQACKERNNELFSLGLAPELNKKILKAKNEEGKPVFDKEGMTYLAEISKAKDGAFYKFILKNIDCITAIEKTKMPSFDIDLHEFKVNLEKPNGKTTATFVVSDMATVMKATDYTEDGLPVIIERVSDDTLASEQRKIYFGEQEKIVYDKFKQTITTEKYDPSGKLYFSRVVSVSKNDEIDNVYERRFDNTDENDITSFTIAKDLKNAIEIESTEYKTPVRYNVTEQTRVYKNPRTGRVETLKMSKSAVPGVYNSTITDDLGNTRVESKGEVDAEGNVSVIKNFESFDGTTTEYSYKANADKTDIKMNYVIKDVAGNAISTVDRTFKRVSPTLAYSSVNGHRYVIETKDEKFYVTDGYTGETIEIADLYYDEESKKHPELFNKLSGDMLLDMHNRGYKYSYVDDLYDSGMTAANKVIEAQDDVFTFAHEQGHTKDIVTFGDADCDKSRPANTSRFIHNKEFKNAYISERRQLREKAPELEREYVSYFTSSLERGCEELIAEANALFSTGMANKDGDFTRIYYLQKYFPRTLAAASKLLMPNSNFYLVK